MRADRHSPAELALTVVAFVAAATSPLALVLSATAGMLAPLPPASMATMPKDMPQMMLSQVMWPDQVQMALSMPDQTMLMLRRMMAAQPVMAGLSLYVLIPALVVLVAVYLYARGRHPGLANCMLAGAAAGTVATVACDWVRLLGWSLRWMPANPPPMFGMLILGPQASPREALVVGYIYHFLNGASFGLLYTLVVGRGRVLWAMAWGLIIGVLMMVTPPMLMMGMRPFGIGYTPGYAVTILVAHIFGFGLVLGWLVQRWACDEEPALGELAERTLGLHFSAAAAH
jgi:hypothetical protein